jgi:DNA-binding transcriptional ArsR family regulator
MGHKDIHEKDRHQINGAKLAKITSELPDENTILYLSQLFGILSDPTRLKIVLTLQEHELCVHEISEAVGMSVSAISHQLRILRAMKLVKYHKQGKMVYYSLDDKHIEQLLQVAKEHVWE